MGNVGNDGAFRSDMFGECLTVGDHHGEGGAVVIVEGAEDCVVDEEVVRRPVVCLEGA